MPSFTPPSRIPAAPTSLPDVAFVLPTRNRADRLAATLARLADLPAAPVGRGGRRLTWEVIVVDNASNDPASVRSVVPDRLPHGPRVRFVPAERNLGAAARNRAAAATTAPLLCMLDDDSWPVDAGVFAVADDWLAVLASSAAMTATTAATAATPSTSPSGAAPADLARTFAIGARITLGSAGGEPERGGLPEVFVGCGVLIRRDLLLSVGGFDETFEYYAEEYDLCARLIACGWGMRHDARLHIVHEKDAGGRDMDRILRLLVRNNGWVNERSTPARLLDREHARLVTRYRTVAEREGAMRGFELGLAELEATRASERASPRRLPLSEAAWRRFMGQAAVEAHLRRWLPSIASAAAERRAERRRRRGEDGSTAGDGPMVVAVIGAGKNWEVVVETLQALADEYRENGQGPTLEVRGPIAAEGHASDGGAPAAATDPDTSPLGLIGDPASPSSRLRRRLAAADVVIPGTLSPGMVALASARLRTASGETGPIVMEPWLPFGEVT